MEHLGRHVVIHILIFHSQYHLTCHKERRPEGIVQGV